MAAVYERVAPAVANIFDVTLRLPAAGGPQAIEQPEGNGSGFVWDEGAAARGLEGSLQCRLRPSPGLPSKALKHSSRLSYFLVGPLPLS